MSNVTFVCNQMARETRVWRQAVQNAGGGFQWNSVAIADAFVKRLRITSYYTKIKWLLPMLGTGIGAARVPLIDTLNIGAATSTAFVNADFNQSTGLQGNGTTKYLDTLILPSLLGAGGNGGIGYVAETVDQSGTTSIVCGMLTAGNAQRYALDLRNTTTNQFFFWGASANAANQAQNAVAAHYYGQRSSTTSRELFLNATSIGTNTTSDSAANIGDNTLILMGSNNSGTFAFNKGLCGAAYLTDGTLTPAEISDFNLLIRAYLLGPTGKGQP